MFSEILEKYNQDFALNTNFTAEFFLLAQPKEQAETPDSISYGLKITPSPESEDYLSSFAAFFLRTVVDINQLSFLRLSHPLQLAQKSTSFHMVLSQEQYEQLQKLLKDVPLISPTPLAEPNWVEFESYATHFHPLINHYLNPNFAHLLLVQFQGQLNDLCCNLFKTRHADQDCFLIQIMGKHRRLLTQAETTALWVNVTFHFKNVGSSCLLLYDPTRINYQQPIGFNDIFAIVLSLEQLLPLLRGVNITTLDRTPSIQGRRGISGQCTSYQSFLPLLEKIEPGYVQHAPLKTSENTLGHGVYGSVIRTRYKSEEVAAKIAFHSLDFPLFFQEAALLTQINHPYIIKLLAFYPNARPTPIIVMEYMEAGLNLHKLLTTDLDIQLIKRITLLYHIALALCHLHSLKIVHADVKAANILINRDRWIGKLADFGLAFQQISANNCFDIIGSGAHKKYQAGYHASEVPSLGHSPKSDMHSFGLALYQTINYVPNQCLPLPDLEGRILSFKKSVPEKMAYACLFYKPSLRPTAEQATENLSLWLSQERLHDTQKRGHSRSASI